MSGFKVLSASKKFKDIVECLHHGSATTREIIVLSKSNVQFDIHFSYSFTYDHSNGLIADKPVITNIIKSDGNNATEKEISIIEYFIKQNYK